MKDALLRFYTVSELAALLRVHRRTIGRDIEVGLLAAHHIRGVLRISEQDALSYMRKTRRLSRRRRKPRSD